MQDLIAVNQWLEEKMHQKEGIDTAIFETIIEKVLHRQQLVQLYLDQKKFSAEQIEQEQALNQNLYSWIHAMRNEIQKQLTDIQKSKTGNQAYQEVKAEKDEGA